MDDRVWVVCGSTTEPRRVGDSAPFPFSTSDVDLGALRWGKYRPAGSWHDRGFPAVEGVHMRGTDDRVSITTDQPLYINGHPREPGRAHEVPVGSTVRLGESLLLYLTRRQPFGPQTRLHHDFGEPDEDRIVGESPAIWRFRSALDAVAKTDEGVLLTGGSWLWNDRHAEAIHRLSARAGRYVRGETCSAYEDVCVFGNAMTGVPGMLGGAEGGTLFIQAFGGETDAPFIRAFAKLRAYGELYYPVYGMEPRKADFRLVLATTREQSIDEIHPELLRRAPLRVEVPPLNDRREDVPLFVRAMFLEDIARGRGDLESRFIATAEDGFPYLTLPLECIERLMHLDHGLRDEVSPRAAYEEAQWAWERDPRNEPPARAVVVHASRQPPLDPRIDALRPVLDTIPPDDPGEPQVAALEDSLARTLSEWCNGWFHRGYERKDLVAAVFLRSHDRPLVMRRTDLARMLPEAAERLAEADVPADRVAIVMVPDSRFGDWRVSGIHVPTLDVPDTRDVFPVMNSEQRSRVEARIAALEEGLTVAAREWDGLRALGAAAIILSADGRARFVHRPDLDPKGVERTLLDAADYPAEYGKVPVLVMPEGNEGPAVVWRSF